MKNRIVFFVLAGIVFTANGVAQETMLMPSERMAGIIPSPEVAGPFQPIISGYKGSVFLTTKRGSKVFVHGKCRLAEGDKIKVYPGASIRIIFDDNSIIMLGADSEAEIKSLFAGNAVLYLRRGSVLGYFKQNIGDFSVFTPNMRFSIGSGEFYISYSNGASRAAVFENGNILYAKARDFSVIDDDSQLAVNMELTAGSKGGVETGHLRYFKKYGVAIVKLKREIGNFGGIDRKNDKEILAERIKYFSAGTKQVKKRTLPKLTPYDEGVSARNRVNKEPEKFISM